MTGVWGGRRRTGNCNCNCNCNGTAVLFAEDSIEVEVCGGVVLAGVGGVEAYVADLAVGGDCSVPGLIGEGDVGTLLGVATAPELIDLLVVVEGPGQAPAVEGRGAGVANYDGSGKASLPVLEIGVGDAAGNTEGN